MRKLLGMVLGAVSFAAVEASEYLIYTYNADGKQALYQRDLTSGTVTRLTDPTYNVWTASFAPDGKWLVFSSDETGTDQIYSMNTDGSGRQRLTFDTEQNYHPFVSPDGKKIAYSRESVGEIILMNADGSQKEVIAPHEKNNVHPMFSPDGTQLMFYSERLLNEAEAPGIFFYDIGSGSIKHTGFYGYHPRFSPDGKNIAFATPEAKGGKWQIYVGNLENTDQLQQITATSVNQNHPAFSPDGRRLYFVSWQHTFDDPETGKTRRSNEVHRANLEDGTIERVTHRNAIAWHPEIYSTVNN